MTYILPARYPKKKVPPMPEGLANIVCGEVVVIITW